MLEVGTKAPDFTLQNQEGKEVSLSDFKGKKVILYFYPKDLTSGCTKQACGFKERYPLITEKGAVVIGISKDSVKKHEEFVTTYPFPLRFFPIQNIRSRNFMTYGRKRACTGGNTWARNAQPTSLMKKAPL